MAIADAAGRAEAGASAPFIHPNFVLGIGAQKCGSTWLHRQLYSHPEIWVPPLKELRFFDHLEQLNVTRTWILERLRRNRRRARRARWKLFGRSDEDRFRIEFVDWLEGAARRMEGLDGLALYASLFADREPAAYRAFGEVTPTYSSMDEAGIARMAKALPHAKIVFVLRDPVMRSWSMAKKIALDSRDEPALLEDARFFRRYVSLDAQARTSRYDLAMSALERHYPQDQLLYEFHEEIFASREDVLSFLRRLCRFLGLTYDERFFPRAGEVIIPSREKPINATAIEILQQVYWPVVGPVEERLGHLPDAWGKWARTD